ncbi:MAG TPA: hypothetical protein VHO27_06295 [Angustibacter sp.]|nr:hypothetical protein [Angustibacter sp.]
MTALSAAALALAVGCRPVRRRVPQGSARGGGGRGAGALRARRRVGRGARAPVEPLLQVLDMVAAQVWAGAAPVLAWQAALDVVAAPSAAATPDPAADLERWAARADARGGPVAAAAQAAAAAWRLAERTGAPLADLLDSVCATLRADQADRAAVEAALAGPRATSRLLLTLPVAGIAVGELVGAAPLHVLSSTPAGQACAVTGATLMVVGRLWMRRQVAAVEAVARATPRTLGAGVGAAP